MNKKWKICCKKKYIQANVHNVASKVKKGWQSHLHGI